MDNHIQPKPGCSKDEDNDSDPDSDDDVVVVVIAEFNDPPAVPPNASDEVEEELEEELPLSIDPEDAFIDACVGKSLGLKQYDDDKTDSDSTDIVGYDKDDSRYEKPLSPTSSESSSSSTASTEYNGGSDEERNLRNLDVLVDEAVGNSKHEQDSQLALVEDDQIEVIDLTEETEDIHMEVHSVDDDDDDNDVVYLCEYEDPDDEADNLGLGDEDGLGKENDLGDEDDLGHKIDLGDDDDGNLGNEDDLLSDDDDSLGEDDPVYIFDEGEDFYLYDDDYHGDEDDLGDEEDFDGEDDCNDLGDEVNVDDLSGEIGSDKELCDEASLLRDLINDDDSPDSDYFDEDEDIPDIIYVPASIPDPDLPDSPGSPSESELGDENPGIDIPIIPYNLVNEVCDNGDSCCESDNKEDVILWQPRHAIIGGDDSDLEDDHEDVAYTSDENDKLPLFFQLPICLTTSVPLNHVQLNFFTMCQARLLSEIDSGLQELSQHLLGATNIPLADEARPILLDLIYKTTQKCNNFLTLVGECATLKVEPNITEASDNEKKPEPSSNSGPGVLSLCVYFRILHVVRCNLLKHSHRVSRNVLHVIRYRIQRILRHRLTLKEAKGESAEDEFDESKLINICMQMDEGTPETGANQLNVCGEDEDIPSSKLMNYWDEIRGLPSLCCSDKKSILTDESMGPEGLRQHFNLCMQLDAIFHEEQEHIHDLWSRESDPESLEIAEVEVMEIDSE